MNRLTTIVLVVFVKRRCLAIGDNGAQRIILDKQLFNIIHKFNQVQFISFSFSNFLCRYIELKIFILQS